MDGAAQCDAHAGSESSTPDGKRMRGWRARIRDEHGSIMIETAASFMVMMLMVLGIMECCMMVYTYSVLEDAAREGVRYASVHGTDSASCAGPSTGCDAAAANVISDVKTYAGTFVGNISGILVTVSYPDGVSTGTSRVQVTISETYQSVFHLPAISQHLSVSSEGRILY